MKSPKYLAPALLAVAAFLSAQPANACNTHSYAMDHSGRCINLDQLTWLGKAREATEAVDNEVVPYEFTLSDFVTTESLTSATLKMTNVSENTTIKLSFATITAPNGSTWSPPIGVAADIPPGGVYTTSVFFDGNFSAEDTFTAAYNPRVDRDYAGVNQLLDAESSAWNQAYLYDLGLELQLCLVDEDHLVTLGRTDCPRHMTASTGNSCFKRTGFGLGETIFKAPQQFSCSEKPSKKYSKGKG